MTTEEARTTDDAYYWDVDGSLNSLVAEAAVAGHYAASGLETVWLGGNTNRVDVVAGPERVDVKCAFQKSVWTRHGQRDCLGFMGARSRAAEVREGVTHYWLVEVQPSGQFRTSGAAVSLAAHFDVVAYNFSKDEINDRFERAWTKRDNALGAGANLYLPYKEAQNNRVELAVRPAL